VAVGPGRLSVELARCLLAGAREGLLTASMGTLEHARGGIVSRLCLLTLVLAACLEAGCSLTLHGTPPTVTINVDRGRPIAVSQLSLGVTHTEHDLDSGDPRAVSAASSLLRSTAVYQDQAMMGWGTQNPEPGPGRFDWSSLDARMRLIQSSGGIAAITLCCAPDWMKGGVPGTTNWSQLNIAPTPDHYADFASLAKAVARRYPWVLYFQVWNEMKGFWNFQANRWDYEGYTTLYNDVYDALKSVNPAIQVGGPYVLVDNRPDHQGPSEFGNPTLHGSYGSVDPRVLDVLTYWLDHKHGADFVTLDGVSYINGAELFAPGQAFADVTTWIASQTTLPVWWAEWYATPWGGQEYSNDQQDAVMTDALAQMMMAGASVSLRWQPQAAAGRNDENIWTDTSTPGGGQPLPFYYSAKILHDDFLPGTLLYRASSSSAQVEAFASWWHVLAINKGGAAVTVGLGSTVRALAPYGVMLLR